MYKTQMIVCHLIKLDLNFFLYSYKSNPYGVGNKNPRTFHIEPLYNVWPSILIYLLTTVKSVIRLSP